MPNSAPFFLLLSLSWLPISFCKMSLWKSIKFKEEKRRKDDTTGEAKWDDNKALDTIYLKLTSLKKGFLCWFDFTSDYATNGFRPRNWFLLFVSLLSLWPLHSITANTIIPFGARWWSEVANEMMIHSGSQLTFLWWYSINHQLFIMRLKVWALCKFAQHFQCSQVSSILLFFILHFISFRFCYNKSPNAWKPTNWLRIVKPLNSLTGWSKNNQFNTLRDLSLRDYYPNI